MLLCPQTIIIYRGQVLTPDRVTLVLKTGLGIQSLFAALEPNSDWIHGAFCLNLLLIMSSALIYFDRLTDCNCVVKWNLLS